MKSIKCKPLGRSCTSYTEHFMGNVASYNKEELKLSLITASKESLS